ncbi:hypothetical protein FQZ97_1132360 [compost metagenome]
MSITTFTAGIAVKPKVSPQPTIPSSVVTLTNRESTICRSFGPQTPPADGPPVVKGIRSGMVSMLAIFIGLRLKQVAWVARRFWNFARAGLRTTYMTFCCPSTEQLLLSARPWSKCYSTNCFYYLLFSMTKVKRSFDCREQVF